MFSAFHAGGSELEPSFATKNAVCLQDLNSTKQNWGLWRSAITISPLTSSLRCLYSFATCFASPLLLRTDAPSAAAADSISDGSRLLAAGGSRGRGRDSVRQPAAGGRRWRPPAAVADRSSSCRRRLPAAACAAPRRGALSGAAAGRGGPWPCS